MNAYKAREPRAANENCCAKSIMEDITKWSPLRCNACIKTAQYTPLHTMLSRVYAMSDYYSPCITQVTADGMTIIRLATVDSVSWCGPAISATLQLIILADVAIAYFLDVKSITVCAHCPACDVIAIRNWSLAARCQLSALADDWEETCCSTFSHPT